MLTIENFGNLEIIEDYLLNKFEKSMKKYSKESFFDKMS